MHTLYYIGNKPEIFLVFWILMKSDEYGMFKELDDYRMYKILSGFWSEFWSEFCRLTLVSNHSDDYGILQELDDRGILLSCF